MNKLLNELNKTYIIINGNKVYKTDLYIAGNKPVITTNSVLYTFNPLLIDKLVEVTKIQILKNDIIFSKHYYNSDTVEIIEILNIANNCVRVKNAANIISKIYAERDIIKLKCILACNNIERKAKNDIFDLFISNANKFKNKDCSVKLDDNYAE